jgi:hypothetical protein
MMHIDIILIGSIFWTSIHRLISRLALVVKIRVPEVEMVSSQILLSLLIKNSSESSTLRRLLELELVRCLVV